MANEDSWAAGRFHDAEVTSLRLERSGPTLELGVTVDPRAGTGHSMLLSFPEVTDVDLVGFNRQNVLFDITTERTPEGRWRVKLSSSYGLSGRFQCAELPEVPPVA